MTLLRICVVENAFLFVDITFLKNVKPFILKKINGNNQEKCCFLFIYKTQDIKYIKKICCCFETNEKKLFNMLNFTRFTNPIC